MKVGLRLTTKNKSKIKDAITAFSNVFLIFAVLRVDNSKAYSDLLSLRAEVDQFFTFLQSILFSCVNCVFREKK